MKLLVTNHFFAVIYLILSVLNYYATDEDFAEGKLLVNNQETHFQYAYAIAQQAFFNNSKEDILVILTDIPLSEEVIENSIERKRMMQEGKLHSVEVVIDENQNPISVTVLHSAFKAPPSGRGYEVLEIKTFDKKLVEGKLYTSKPNEFFNTTYEFNAKFSATIRRKVLPTEEDKKLAAVSQHAAIYRKYRRTILNSDFDGLTKLVSSEILNEMSADEADEMFEFLQMTMPSKVEFLRLKVDDDKATLEMEGEIDGKTISGNVEFLRENQQWKVGQNQWDD